jgi:Domain of Unknown Function (DUF1521)
MDGIKCGCVANSPSSAVDKPSTAYDSQGNAQFENKNYKIGANEGGTVNITNKNTGETYQAWGDPHMKIDGQQAFDFWGTTTFNLDDGTKVTIDTTPWKGGNNRATISSKVTIVDGDYGVQITGVDDNQSGDLKFNETTNGWLMDAMVDDGNTMYENPVGKGFVAMDDCGNIQNVDQKWVDGTDLVKNGGKEKTDELVQQFSALVSLFTGIMSIAFAGAFLSVLGNSNSSNNESANDGKSSKPAPKDRQQPMLDNQRPTDFDFVMIAISRHHHEHAMAA